jgi:hypothetical protein
MYITEDQALHRYPELGALVTLRQAAWQFRLIGDTDLEGIVATCNRQRYTDALWIYDADTVIGLRILDEAYGGTVWKKTSGTVAEIAQELLGLPEPDDRLAPKLVKWPGTLWTPQ